MKFTLLTAFAASAAAFAPAPTKQHTTALKSYENEVGAMTPVSLCRKENARPF